MSLLQAIETCLKLTNVPPSRFGRDSVRDPRLVHDLRRGRQPGQRIEKRVHAYIAHSIASIPDSGLATPSARRSAAALLRASARVVGCDGPVPARDPATVPATISAGGASRIQPRIVSSSPGGGC